MAARQVNPNAELVLICSADDHYREELVAEHSSLVRVLTGELKVVLANRTHTFGPGDTLLFPRRQLATLIAYPQDGRPYEAVIMWLTTDRLRAYYAQAAAPTPLPYTPSVLPIVASPLLDSFFASLVPYSELQQPLPEQLSHLKTTEAVEILRGLHDQTDSVLADFAEPGKINLPDFMETNYMFNLPLARFSTLTGRSLTTFKRDFKRAFQLSPQRWLTQKRLELAHYHLAEHGRTPADLYYEVGFENLSHFSYAFKKRFGYPPTALRACR